MSDTKPIQKTDVLTVLLHWMLVITLGFSLLTGLQISADNPDSTWAHAVSALLLQGNVIEWHTWAAFVMFFTTVTYVVYLFRARLKARVALDATRMRGLGADRQTRWKSINVLINWLAFVLILIATLSGVALYFFAGILPHETVISIHKFVAWSIIAYVLLHVFAQLVFGGWRHLLKIVNPCLSYSRAASTSLVFAALASAGMLLVNKASITTLQVVKTSTPPTLDGIADDVIWKETPAIEIATQRGMNLPGGEVQVTAKMAYDDTHLYALFEWPDTTRSQKHLPLIKTEKGWKVLQNDYYKQDENEFYEDKFAVMLGHSPEIAGAGTTHYGKKPLKDKPGPLGGRGLHYTTNGNIVDVWHWKSVRTGSLFSNQMDDNYFGPPMDVNPREKRYTGGYTQDPGTIGGYTMNWEKFDRETITPRWLPKNQAVLARMRNVDLDPAVSDKGEFWMSPEMTIKYDKELDKYPVGTVIPSVIITGPREGDRGDVQGFSEWKDGKWSLEVSRKLDTQSEYDLALKKDQPLYMWLGVFDHTQTRHSQHLHPVKIEMN
jgi:cytochrome b subunit of formate dehydrogenase